jgi:2'-5' RNA ligase superfamily
VDEVRVDFALIPGEPLFGEIVRASQAITDEYYYNENIIDERTFPPHLSLHICTLPASTVDKAVTDLRDLVTEVDLPAIVPTGVSRSYGGYIMVNIDRTAEIMALHEAVLEIAAAARENLSGDKYGSQFIRKAFDPHISLAKVDSDDVSGAERIGQDSSADWKTLGAHAQTLDLSDIGMRSEQWKHIVSISK